MVDSFTNTSFSIGSFNTDYGLGKMHTTDALKKALNIVKEFVTNAHLVYEKTRNHITNAYTRKIFGLLDNSYTLQSFTNNSFKTDNTSGSYSIWSYLTYSDFSTFGGGSPKWGKHFNNASTFELKSVQTKFSGTPTGTVVAKAWQNATGTTVNVVVTSNETYNCADVEDQDIIFTFPANTIPVNTDIVIGLEFSNGANLTFYRNTDGSGGRVQNGGSWTTTDSPSSEILISLYPLTHTTNSAIKSLGDTPVTHTTDSKIVHAGTHFTDSTLYAVIPVTPYSYTEKSFNSESFTTLPQKPHHTDSSLKKLGSTIITYTDAYLKVQKQSSHTTNTWLQKSYTVLAQSFSQTSFTNTSYTTDNVGGLGHITNSLLKKTGVMKSFTTNSWLQNIHEPTHTTNTYILKTFTTLASSYSDVSYTGTSYTVDTVPYKTHPTDSYLKRLGKTVTHTTDTYRVKARSHTTDARLYLTQNVSIYSYAESSFNSRSYTVEPIVYRGHYTDSGLKKLGYTKEHFTNSYLKVPSQDFHTTNARLYKVQTSLNNSYSQTSFTTTSYTTDNVGGLGHYTDSLLKIKDIVKSHTVSSRLAYPNSLSFTTDALLKLQEKSYNAASYTSTSYTTRFIYFAGHTTDSYLKKEVSPIHTTSSHITYPITKTHTTDTFIRRGWWFINHSYTDVSFTRVSYTMDVGSLSHTTDTITKASGVSRLHFADSFLAPAKHHTTNSWLDRDDPFVIHSYTTTSYTGTSYTTNNIRTVGQTTDAKLKKSGVIKSHTTNSVLRVPNQASHTTNARLYKPQSVLNNSYTNVSFTSTSYTVDTAPYKNHTTNSRLKRLGDIKSHTTNSYIVRVRSHTTNSVLYLTTPISLASYTGSSYTTTSYTTQVITTKGHTTNSFLNSIRIKIHTTNSYLKYAIPKSHTTNSYIQKQLSVRRDSYTNVSYTNRSYTISRRSFNALSYTDTSYTTETPRLPTHTTDALLKKITTKSHTTNSWLQLPNQKSHTTDVRLYKPVAVSPYSYSNTSFTSTSYTVDISTYTPHTTDSLLKKKNVIWQHTTNSALRVPQAPTHTTDASIKIQEWSYNAASFTSTSYRVKLLTFLGHTTDSKLLAITTRTHTTNSALRVPHAPTHTTDARLYKPFLVLNNSFTPTSYTGTSYTVDTNIYAGHTTNSLLKKITAQSFTTDSYIVRVKTHTTNSHLYLTTPTSVNSYTGASYTSTSYTVDTLRIIGHYTDAKLKKLGIVKLFTTDSYLKIPKQTTHTTDSRLLKTFTSLSHSYTGTSYTDTSYTVDTIPYKAHTTDSKLKRLDNVKAHTTNSYIVKSKSHTTDAVTKLTYSVLPYSYKSISYTSESYTVNLVITKTHTTNSELVFGILHRTDSALKKLGDTKVHTTDSRLKKLGDIKTHTTDTLKKKVDVVLMHTTDALKKKVDNILSHTTNALLKKINIILTHTTDSALKKLGDTKVHTTDSALKKLGDTKVHTTDALKKKVDNVLTHTTDALKKVVNITLTHTTDSRLKALDIIKTHTTNSVLKKVDNTKTHTTDSVLRLTITKTHTTDALLKKLNIILTHTTDALKKKVDNVLSHTTNSSVQFTYEKTHTTDAKLKSLDIIKTHTTDAKLKALDIIKTHTTNSTTEYVISKSHTTNALLKKVDNVLSHTTNSFLKHIITKSHTTDAKLKKLGEIKTHATDSNLKGTPIKTHTTNSRLAEPNSINHDTDSYLIKFGETKSHTTSSALKNQIRKTHITDADLKGTITKAHTTNSTLEKQIIRLRGTSVIAPTVKATTVITTIIQKISVIEPSNSAVSVITPIIKGTSVIDPEVEGGTSI